MKHGTPGFIGERLKEGKQARGFTSTALAVPLQVTPAAITQYEKGDQSPRPDVMDRIADILQLPVAFFTKSVQREEGVIYWRSLNSATLLSRTVAERRLGWVQDIAGYCQQYLEFAPLDLPDLEIPRDPLQISNELIDRSAAHLRSAWGLGEEPIENVADLLESKGIFLAREDLNAASLDALAKWCPIEGRAYCLVSSARGSAARSRLNLLHELGHLALHRHLDRYHLENKKLHALIEEQAFRFGGAFGLPAEPFSADVYSYTLDAFLRLKEKWKFSVGMMLKRCESLEMIKEETSQRLWRAMSAKGWRTEEPLDDTLPHEHPRLLGEALQSLMDDGQTISQIVHGLALPENDVRELANLPASKIVAHGSTVISMTPAIGHNEPRDVKARVLKFPRG